MCFAVIYMVLAGFWGHKGTASPRRGFFMWKGRIQGLSILLHIDDGSADGGDDGGADGGDDGDDVGCDCVGVDVVEILIIITIKGLREEDDNFTPRRHRWKFRIATQSNHLN